MLGLAASAQAQPAPVLKYVGQHPDLGLIHVDLAVTNWQAYPPAMFASAPNLPRCAPIRPRRAPGSTSTTP
jgi:hypothetical protein